jgi:hypothetical protein
MKKILIFAIFLTIPLLINNHPVFADLAACGCYCGAVLPPPCSDDACKRACHWQGSSTTSATTSYTPPSYDYEAERQRQEEIQRQEQAERADREEKARKEAEAAKRRQEEFEKNKQDALGSMKGITENELGLKGVSADNGLGLKGVGETGKSDLGLKEVASATPAEPVNSSAVVDLRFLQWPRNSSSINISGIKVQEGVNNPDQLRQGLLGNFSDTIDKRANQPNQQAQEIMRSFKMKEPPSPVKNIADLAPGDVILVAASDMESEGIRFLDRYGSDNWTSPASHAATYLGERDGKRWYLDNTMEGPVIKDEAEFMKKYGSRQMDVATLVGQPLSQHEGEELWKGANELMKTTKYGPSGFLNITNDRMVCSETSRWLLVRAGRRVPKTESEDKTILGVKTHLNKNKFVDFSPSDFYAKQQYFVIHQLGTKKKGETKP